MAQERVLSEPIAPFGEGEPGGRGRLTRVGDPPILLPPTASARARRLTPLPGEANGPFQAGGHVALIKREGRRRGGSRCCWWRAGAGRKQSAAAREARGWRAGAGARAAAASVGGEHPGAARAAAAAAMAVAVGRPSVSAGASLSSSASPPALVGERVPAGGRVSAGTPGAGAGARDGCGGGSGCVYEFGRASGAKARARSREARLLRDATVDRPGLGMWEKKDPFPVFCFFFLLTRSFWPRCFSAASLSPRTPFLWWRWRKAPGAGLSSRLPRAEGRPGRGNC